MLLNYIEPSYEVYDPLLMAPERITSSSKVPCVTRAVVIFHGLVLLRTLQSNPNPRAFDSPRQLVSSSGSRYKIKRPRLCIITFHLSTNIAQAKGLPQKEGMSAMLVSGVFGRALGMLALIGELSSIHQHRMMRQQGCRTELVSCSSCLGFEAWCVLSS